MLFVASVKFPFLKKVIPSAYIFSAFLLKFFTHESDNVLSAMISEENRRKKRNNNPVIKFRKRMNGIFIKGKINFSFIFTALLRQGIEMNNIYEPRII